METNIEIRSYSMIFRMREDGIIEARPIPEWKGETTLAHAQKDMECLRMIAAGKLCPILSYLADAVVTKEARQYYAENPPLSIACGLVVNSYFQRMFGNFLLGVRNIDAPLRLFTEEKEAVEWLLERKAMYEKSKLWKNGYCV
jgi:hypothetical protein